MLRSERIGVAHYDLAAGSVSAGVTDSQGQEGVLQAEDEYRIIGLPDGTPLAFKARLVVSLQQCSFHDYELRFSTASASLAEGSNVDQVSIGYVEGCETRNDSLEIDLSHLAGEVFRLVLGVAGSGVSGSAEGVLSFVGLPPGAVVSSCHGFRQDAPTGVRRSTWGGLKALYR